MTSSFTSGANIAVRFGFRGDIVSSIAKHYGKTARDPMELQRESGVPAEEWPGDERRQIEFFSASSRQTTKDAFQEVQAELTNERTPAVRVVSEVIQAAVEQEASDIHIEPQENETVVRLRVDGVLRDLQRVPRALQNSPGFAHQDPFRHGYRRAAGAAGRALHGRAPRAAAGHAGVDAAHTVRREGGDAAAGFASGPADVRAIWGCRRTIGRNCCGCWRCRRECCW